MFLKNLQEPFKKNKCKLQCLHFLKIATLHLLGNSTLKNTLNTADLYEFANIASQKEDFAFCKETIKKSIYNITSEIKKNNSNLISIQRLQKIKTKNYQKFGKNFAREIILADKSILQDSYINEQIIILKGKYYFKGSHKRFKKFQYEAAAASENKKINYIFKRKKQTAFYKKAVKRCADVFYYYRNFKKKLDDIRFSKNGWENSLLLDEGEQILKKIYSGVLVPINLKKIILFIINRFAKKNKNLNKNKFYLFSFIYHKLIFYFKRKKNLNRQFFLSLLQDLKLKFGDNIFSSETLVNSGFSGIIKMILSFRKKYLNNHFAPKRKKQFFKRKKYTKFFSLEDFEKLLKKGRDALPQINFANEFIYGANNSYKRAVRPWLSKREWAATKGFLWLDLPHFIARKNALLFNSTAQFFGSFKDFCFNLNFDINWDMEKNRELQVSEQKKKLADNWIARSLNNLKKTQNEFFDDPPAEHSKISKIKERLFEKFLLDNVRENFLCPEKDKQKIGFLQNLVTIKQIKSDFILNLAQFKSFIKDHQNYLKRKKLQKEEENKETFSLEKINTLKQKNKKIPDVLDIPKKNNFDFKNKNKEKDLSHFAKWLANCS